jgi:TetR/AcrR family transcriptional regulator
MDGQSPAIPKDGRPSYARQEKQSVASVDRKAGAGKPGRPRRGQGRPVVGENEVGSERLLDAAEALLRAMPPARVTIARIAQQAGADPALVRYYFGNRTALLLAVANRVNKNGPHMFERPADPQEALAEQIRRTAQFVLAEQFMHRLMIEELGDAGTEESRVLLRDLNRGAIDSYKAMLDEDAGASMAPTNPLFLHLAVLGASDFFASAEPLIRQLAPPDTDMKALSAQFREYLVELVLNGLRKR